MNNEIDDIQKDREEWLKIIYVEGWKQYIHEDNLEMIRTNFFLGIQLALIAILAAGAKPLLEITLPSGDNTNLQIGKTLLGFLLIFTGGIMIFITYIWRDFTETSKKYAHFRRVQLAAYEKLAKIDDIGLATKELEWRDSVFRGMRSDLQIFANVPGLENFKINSTSKTRVWSIMPQHIFFRVWLSVWIVIMLVGIVINFL